MARGLRSNILDQGTDLFPDLIPLLPEQLLPVAAAAARRMVDLDLRARVLAGLSVRVPDGASMLQEAIDAARASDWPANALLGIASRIPDVDRRELITEAIAGAGSFNAPYIVIEAIRVAPTEMLPEVWDATDLIGREDLPTAFRALGLRASDLGDDLRARIRARASALRPSSLRLRCLVGLLPLLDEGEQAQVLEQGLAAFLRARSVDTDLLVDFAPAWSDAQQLTVLGDLARAGGDDEQAGAEVLSGLLHPAVVLEWAKGRRPVVVEGQIDRWLLALMAHLPLDAQLEIVGEIRRTHPAAARRQALADVAGSLDATVLRESLVAARDAGEADDWALALPGLADLLERSLVPPALSLALAVKHPAGRERALVALVPRLPERDGRDLAHRVLQELDLLPRDERGTALETIAPRLGSADLLAAVEAARDIRDPYGRTSAIQALAERLGARAFRRLLADPRNAADPEPWAALIRDRPADLRPADLATALPLAAAVEDPDERAETMAHLVRLAAGDRRTDLVRAVVGDLRAGARGYWTDTLMVVAAYLGPAGVSGVELAREIEDPAERRVALEGMRPFLDPPEQAAADAMIPTLPEPEPAGGRGAGGGDAEDPIAAVAALPAGKRDRLLEGVLAAFTADLPHDEHRGTRAEPPTTPFPAGDERPPHRAFGVVDCPAEVVVHETFAVKVGLSPTQAPGVAGREMSLPPLEVRSYSVWVRIAAPGFSVAPGQRYRQELRVSLVDPYPSVAVDLVARPSSLRLPEPRITAEFSIGGGRIADAIRSLSVVATEAERTRPADDRVASGIDLPAPTGASVADLTLTVRISDSARTLDWTFESPHPVVDQPDAPLPGLIGKDPEAFLDDLVSTVGAEEGDPGIYTAVLGKARDIEAAIPPEVWTALRSVSAEVGHPPTILLVSEEAYVPWELAHVEPPLLPDPDPSHPAPPFLSAQARIGRWLQPSLTSSGQPRPKPDPPRSKQVDTMAVVWGEYQGIDGWTNLAHAQEEANELIQRYGAKTITAAWPEMYALLKAGGPDLVHFAVHGQWSKDRTDQDGIILADGRVVAHGDIDARTLAGAPVVFLNACQVAAGHAVLGRYSGIAAAFVKAGASCVVAPLWSIDDAVALSVALEFYRRVSAGEPPSEVLRSARTAFVDEFTTTSATTMAYQLFGHPDFVVSGLRTGN